MAIVMKIGVRAVDGECYPISDLEVGARFKYADNPSRWSTETTDGDGVAWFVDEHPEPPLEVKLYLGDTLCDTFPVADGTMLVLEV